jgi:hypothetical protein
LSTELVFDPESPAFFKYDAKVLRGKNGRLFLDNDSNQVLRQYTGDLLFTDSQLRDWRSVLENRIAWLDERGIPYLFLVPPNAYPVYPEDLPDGICAGAVRPVQQLIQHLEETGSLGQVVYPLDEILSAKPNPDLYQKTDTHWSAYAAYIAYSRLAREIVANVPMHVVPEQDVVYQEQLLMGDLGYKVEPKEKSVLVTAIVRNPPVRSVSDNRVLNTGMKIVTECMGAPPLTCILFGDSFSVMLLPFLGSSFRRLVFAHAQTLDYELVLNEQPDVVISVSNERFLMTVPSDDGAPTMRELELEKNAKGLVRPENWFWPPAETD